jgi:1-deoxy-D-xylulose-5-phosphate synthase
MKLKDKTTSELVELAEKIRQRILDAVSQNGGHLSPSLGATDLIVAMHSVFDAQKDPFLFDVSHQAYAHKLITDRWDAFDTLRQWGGMCGYTDPDESEYDYYKAGHSSTSISLAVGAAKAFALKGETDRIPVAFIGDGSMSAGMVYEALNELGERQLPVVIILNDNEMSISTPIGAVSRYLSRTMSSPFYTKLKKKIKDGLKSISADNTAYLLQRVDESLRILTPGLLFEELGIKYIGPIDGHDIEAIKETLEIAKQMKRPVIVHAQTTKGKGYEIAEGAERSKEKWHGVGAFDVSNGESLKIGGTKAATAIFSEELIALAKADPKIVGVTAAMPSGTGMGAVMEAFPDRFWDVAIAEQHAVTSMGPLAKEGFKPFCTIYSTFLQRGYDQVIHDIALMDVGVTFAMDRAGIVGEDGETHQGAFDISYLRPIPNMTLAAPYNRTSLRKIMAFAAEYDRPFAFRYPRGAFLSADHDVPDYVLGKGTILHHGRDIALIGYGNGVGRALQTAELMQADPTVVDLRFVKPLDEALLGELAMTHRRWYVFSDSAAMGGVGSALMEWLARMGIRDVQVHTFEYPDHFIRHGNTRLVEESLGLLPEQLAKTIENQTY